MALIPPLDASPEEVRASLAPLRHDFSIALYSFGNAFAAGAVIRVAHSFLAREIFVIGNAPFYEKASMGMEKYETIVRVPDTAAFFAAVRGRVVWALEKDHARRSLQDVEAFPPGVVFVLGSERGGLPREMLDLADDVLGIPMFGVNHSLPVAVASGIVMHEWARRRYGARRVEGVGSQGLQDVGMTGPPGFCGIKTNT
jgi:tRNA G18 (ribose-2'-O)-methylase SpoU